MKMYLHFYKVVNFMQFVFYTGSEDSVNPLT